MDKNYLYYYPFSLTFRLLKYHKARKAEVTLIEELILVFPTSLQEKSVLEPVVHRLHGGIFSFPLSMKLPLTAATCHG